MSKVPSNRNMSFRLLNRDGTYNIVRKHRQLTKKPDLYHRLLSLPKPVFFGLVMLAFLVANLLFASLYFLAGPGAIQGVQVANEWERFIECFFFSVHTLATIGYGHLHPSGYLANILVTLEAFVGLLGLAVVTGLVFARFARPTARIIFSRNALVTTQDGQKVFLFRIANERLNQVAEAQVSVVLSIDQTTKEGERYRELYDLKLERARSPLFSMTWTIVHPIGADSPLSGLDQSRLRDANAEVMVSFMGTDDIFMQSIQSRFSYTWEDIVWGARFKDILKRSEDGCAIEVDLEGVHDYVRMDG